MMHLLMNSGVALLPSTVCRLVAPQKVDVRRSSLLELNPPKVVQIFSANDINQTDLIYFQTMIEWILMNNKKKACHQP